MATAGPPTDSSDFDPLADILRRCAAAAPRPWYPREFAKVSGVPLSEVAIDVEFLWLEGLVRPDPRPGDQYPGLSLTEAGARVLADPAGVAGLRDGTHAPRGRGAAARQALRTAGAPVVSRWLLAVNLLVFGVSIFLATGRGVAMAYLGGQGNVAVLDVLHRSGSVSADDLIAGRWWRLLTAAFVHGGLLHIVMNGSMLAFGLGLVESMWGRARYLLIYLVAAFGGNCLAIAWHPSVEEGGVEISQPLVGASGALCGVLAATMVWLVFNARHIPRQAASALRTSLITATVFLVFISMFPQVSGLCHLGGALFGAAAAALLYFERWGTGLRRSAAVVGVLALPWLGLHLVDRARATDPRWFRAERRFFEQHYKQRVAEVTGESARVYARRVAPLLAEPPRKRDAARVRRALAEAAEARPPLAALADDLAAEGPFHDAETEHEREAARDRAREMAERFAQAEDLLTRNANSPEVDDAEERAFARQFLKRIPETMGGAIGLYKNDVQPLLAQAPGDRDRAAVEKSSRAAEQTGRKLAALADGLEEAGPYGNATVETARKTAQRYAAARAVLLTAAARCLRAGDKWTPEDEAALQKQADAVAELRQEWEKLVEPEPGQPPANR
jgi:membrane associated rhomboid family serine protease